MRTVLLASALSLLATGCSLAPLQPQGSAVRVLSAAPHGCRPVGRLEVSVTSGVGHLRRNELRVKDELENLARNKAVQLGADAVVPRAPPASGDQVLDAWRCAQP